MPSAVFTSGFARWRVVFEEEIPYDPDQPAQLTAHIDAVLERQIRQSPADWFWVHNRWKTSWPQLLLAKQRRGIYLPPGTDPSTLHPFWFHCALARLAGDAVMSLRAARAFKLTPAKLEAFWKSIAEVDEDKYLLRQRIRYLPLRRRYADASRLRSSPEFVSQRGRGMASRVGWHEA